MKRPKVFAVLPTLLTLGNAACGFGAITILAKVGPENVDGNEPAIAALLIFAAMLFDMLDGSAARWAKQESEFGAELDSLCDMISFGVAPAFLVLQFCHSEFQFLQSALRPPFTYPPRLLWAIAVLYVLCAAMRLARFNVETEDDDSHEFFSGLPSPAAAGTIAAFPIAVRSLDWRTVPVSIAEWVIPAIAVALPLITLGLACLMVSRIRYPHVFNQIFRGKRSRAQLLQVIFTIALVFVVQEMAVPVILLYFAFMAPIKSFWVELRAGRLFKSTAEDDPADSQAA